MSAVADLQSPERGWPELYSSADDFSPDEFLAKVREGAAEDAGIGPEVPPWVDMQAWTHPGPVAEAYFNSDAKVIAMRGPVGSGKTTANLRSRFRRATMIPQSTIDGIRRYKVVIARATYRQLWQTTIPSWWEVMPKNIGTWSGGRGDPVTHRLEWDDAYGRVEMTVEFLAFGESSAEVVANMRGLQCTDLLLEEGDTCHVTVFTTGAGRINRYPEPKHFDGYENDEDDYGQVSITYNATDVDNWAVTTLEGGEGDTPEAKALRAELTRAGIEIKFYRQPGYGEDGTENTNVLAKSYYPTQIATMKAAGQTDAIERLVYNRNSHVVAGDLVFKRDFNIGIHVAKHELEPWPDVPLRLGLDQGLYGAAVIGQFTGPYRWQILGEFWKPHRMLSEEFGEELREYLDIEFPGMSVEMAYGDMAGENDSGAAGENAVWNRVVGDRLGVYIEPQTTGANRIQPRLSAVRAGLAQTYSTADGLRPALLISPCCTGLIRGFAARYVWKDEVSPNGEKTKRPNKSFREADIMDALQYLMLSEQVQEGEAPSANANRNAGHNGGPPLDDAFRNGPINASYDPLELFG